MNVESKWVYERERERERGRELPWFTSLWNTYPGSLASPCLFFIFLFFNPVFSPGIASKTYLLSWLPTQTDRRGLKTSVIIYFPDAHIFLPTQFTWYFRCLLFTLRHSCTSFFLIPYYPACQWSICNTEPYI